MDYLSTQIQAQLRSCYNNISGMPACKNRNELIDQFLELADKLKAVRNEPIQCNTRLNYLYRDAANFKTCNSVVLSGVMTDEMFEEMQCCCEDAKELFIPEQLGLDLIRNWETTEDDHPYAELEDYELVPDKPTIDMTVEELLEKFREAEGNWRPEEYQPEPDYYDSEEDED